MGVDSGRGGTLLPSKDSEMPHIENDRMARARVTGQKVYGVLVSLVIVLLAVAVVTLAAHMTLI